ncbi:MAG: type III restriction endonuclease subunit R, partial [Clostridiales bacterium]|nr:type III restriction endonuclease subunit R [Clostridiales bacterium]
WDVNNLYTIVPLRTAASKILREQMVGRGLRLPYGKRTGDPDVDAVMLTAHDKFKEIMEEAERGDSIFKAGNVIKAEDIEREQAECTQLSFDLEPDAVLEEAYKNTEIKKSREADEAFKRADSLIKEKVQGEIQAAPSHNIDSDGLKNIADDVGKALSDDKDLGEVFKENAEPFYEWLHQHAEDTHRSAQEKFIPIPQIKVTDAGAEEYRFVDFDIDLGEFTHVPIKNELILQNLEDKADRKRIHGDAIDFEGYNPKKTIVDEIRRKPEIDYENCHSLLFKLISQVCDHYENSYGTNGMQNIVMMYKRDIADKIYGQMLRHVYRENGFIQEEIVGTKNYNSTQQYTWSERDNLFGKYKKNIKSVLFDGIKKGVFETAKFDSEPELEFARVIETDADVKNWLRPSSKEFNIQYNGGKNYEPDFVVEAEDKIYLVEVKAEDQMGNPDVVAKKNRAIKYCEVASEWGKVNCYKEWRYLFIPSLQVKPNSSFSQLARQFEAGKEE